jgi:hypothetical protein
MAYYPILTEKNAMNEIWPELIQKTIEPPKTITETVDRLLTVLDREHKAAIAAMPQEELINLHFSLGMAIRNAFGFWDSQSHCLIRAGQSILMTFQTRLSTSFGRG